MAADCQHDLAAGASELVGDLHAGGGRPDDEHAAVGQVAGVAVALGVIWSTAGRGAGEAGTRGRSHQPVAITTLRAVPRRRRSVRTVKPSSRADEPRTSLSCSIGASNEPA